MNCWCAPTATVATGGLTAMLSKVTGGGGSAVTASNAVPLVVPDVAVMVTPPADTPVARPCVPDAFEIVATDESEDAHVTAAVMSCELRSE